MTKKFEKEFFENWASDYDERRNKSYLEKSKLMMNLLIKKFINKNNTFLEIGIGTGEVFELVSKKFDFAYGMDISESMVRRTYSKGQKFKELLVGDSCNLPINSNSIDFIICQDVIEHVPNQKRLILEICRVLRKNGIAIITTPNPLWAGILYLAEKLRLKVEEGEHQFVFLPKLVNQTIDKSECSLISTTPFAMLHFNSRMDRILDLLSKNKFFAKFGFDLMCIIKKINYS